MNSPLPTYLNQVWNFVGSGTGELEIVSGEISENAPTSYDHVIATLDDIPDVEEVALLIANAPNMFRALCNIAGEVKYGTATLPGFLTENINDILHDITRPLKTQDETE